MNIKSLHLTNFKRFTDLKLQDIPQSARLVLLIGSNGSGKSSIFDAFEILNRYKIDKRHSEDKYYNKVGGQYRIVADFGDGWSFDTEKKVFKANEEVKILLTPLYGRTSFRQIPRLNRTQLGQSFDIKSDNDRPRSFIDRDERFENDLEHLFGKLLREFFKKDDDKAEIKKTVIEPINQSLSRIFSTGDETKLELVELIPPLEGKVAEINFKKGESIFHYNLLSAGEKEVFNVLINLISRREFYQDGIVYLDEIDLHLSTTLQFNFLKEIVEYWIVPANCQLWTASHSLGFIQYAKKSHDAIIFDLDSYDFDQPKVLSPEPKENADIYEIAVSKEILSELFNDREIFFVENEDRKYYASLNIDRVIFVPEKNRDGVFYKAKSGQFNGLIDRDFLTEEDIKIIEEHYKSLKILRLYCVENYLFHPENLDEYYLSIKREFNKESYIQSIYQEKQNVLKSLLIKVASIRQGYPFFKEVGQEKSLNKKRFTNDAENFEQATVIISYLESQNINEYLKSFSLKDYCKSLPERQNINPFDLSKTKWFKSQIATIIKRS